MITAISLFTGCTNTRQNYGLSTMTIVQGVGIDLNESETEISLQYLDLEKGASSADSLNGNITATATGVSDSIADAMASASRTLSQEIFLGQNKLIVFGFDYAVNGIEKGLDYLLRSVASRPDVAVALAFGTAESIIKNENREVRVPVENIFNLLELGEKNGLGAIVTVNDLLNLYSDITSDMYLPVLKLEDDTVVCDGIAVFSNSEYKTVLKDEQCFGFLFVKNKIEGGTIVVNDGVLGNVGVEILFSDTDLNFDFDNEKPILNCSIKTKLMLDEIEKGISTAVTEKRIEAIENAVADKINYMCKSALKQCFKNNSDPYMLGKYASRDNEEYYEKNKKVWRSNLQNITVNLYCDVELVRVNDNSVRS